MTVKELKERLNVLPEGYTQEEFDNLKLVINGDDNGDGNLGFYPIDDGCVGPIKFNDEDAGQEYNFFGIWRDK